MAETARRQKSRDWLYAALGVSITVALGLGLDSDATQVLWQQIGSHLGSVVRMPTNQDALLRSK